jgi:hypothetical protein
MQQRSHLALWRLCGGEPVLVRGADRATAVAVGSSGMLRAWTSASTLVTLADNNMMPLQNCDAGCTKFVRLR